jgi:hypothetical protein
MADDELDSLYSVEPDAFTAQRTRLAEAAKKRGDAAAAKRISAARKPTTAAWVVNRLALQRKDAERRLSDLGDRLRAAHAAMDGEQIRDLSAEQHQLIDELARAAFDAAEMKGPSSTLRDDVTGTLQAAIADPDVAARLGRLSRPERWSGFGGVGDASSAWTPTRATAARKHVDNQQLEKLKAAVAAAERVKTEADDALSRLQSERAAARQRRDEARATLRQAERAVDRAEDNCEKALRASRAAADSVKGAKAQLKRA